MTEDFAVGVKKEAAGESDLIERPFGRQMILDSMSSEETFDAAKGFLVDVNLLQYPLNDTEKDLLREINNPREFVSKYMELAIGKWFRITRGE